MIRPCYADRGGMALERGVGGSFWVALLAAGAVGGFWLARASRHGFYAHYYRDTVILLAGAAICLIITGAFLLARPRRETPAPAAEATPEDAAVPAGEDAGPEGA